MKNKVVSINLSDLNLLQGHFSTVKFTHDQELFYENQIPPVGFVLLEGEIQLFKGNTIKQIVNGVNSLGIRNIIYDIPVKYRHKIKANSKVLILGKSDVLELMKDTNSQLHAVLTMLT